MIQGSGLQQLSDKHALNLDPTSSKLQQDRFFAETVDISRKMSSTLIRHWRLSIIHPHIILTLHPLTFLSHNPTEKPNTYTDICASSEVTHRYTHQMLPSGNTPSETITRLGCVIKPTKKYNSEKVFILSVCFFSELTKPCLNHVSNEREMSWHELLPLKKAVTFLVWMNRGLRQCIQRCA